MVSKICDRKISLNDENNYHKSQHHYTAEPVMAEPTAVDFGSCRYMLQCSLKKKHNWTGCVWVSISNKIINKKIWIPVSGHFLHGAIHGWWLKAQNNW